MRISDWSSDVCACYLKFAKADARLTTQMKSVGEVMAIGRTFQESLQKALRGLEVGVCGLDPKLDLSHPDAMSELKRELTVPGAERIWYVADAFRAGMPVERSAENTSALQSLMCISYAVFC